MYYTYMYTCAISAEPKESISSGILSGHGEQDQENQFEREMIHVHSAISSILKAVPL